ncbi:MAG: hypothetical protein IIA60_05230 [Candidatus Marinimicrobia bacterium]|nr:hypothetical protein [Candidatus Neomarinimicrobiota bacterium]
MPKSISAVIEGKIDEIVVIRICQVKGLTLKKVLGKKGKGYIDKNLHYLNIAARNSNWIVIRDLDHDADCPAALRHILLPNPSHLMLFRIANRAVESWLLSDLRAFARYFQVPVREMSEDPDSIDDPKRQVIGLCSKSRSDQIVTGMTPRPGSGGIVGKSYNPKMMDYALNHWDPEEAAQHSDSLSRCLNRLDQI